MSMKLNPQEIYLLERYISLEYFGELRDTWARMIGHVESCLTTYLETLPKDERARSLPQQPGIVWGERILPNFRHTLQGLNTGYSLLGRGDVKGLGYAWCPRSDVKAHMEYWPGWMRREDQNRYGELLDKALAMARNICTTEAVYWKPDDLANYCDQWERLNAPAQWPAYRVNEQVSVIAEQEIRHNGIYVPDVEYSCAQFLGIHNKSAPLAKVLVGLKLIPHPMTGEKYSEERVFEERSCIWYLVERVPDLNEALQAQRTDLAHGARVALGEKCRQIRLYFSSADPDEQSLSPVASHLLNHRLFNGGA